MTQTAATTERYYQIGEAAERCGATQRTLRYYEEKGLLDPPTRMDGGFRLYSEADIERIGRIRQFKDLLGFSLAEIKDMLDAEDVRDQIRAEWRKDLDAAEKAGKIRHSRALTLHQLALIDDKLAKMTAMRAQLAERIEKYDRLLSQWSGDTPA
jgi:DNA-binding transcriptional MerR regulator